MAQKPSASEVLRTLAEEVRERGVHPDREDVLSRYLDDDQEQEPEQAPADKGKAK